MRENWPLQIESRRTAESSPGRESWVRHVPTSSPAGTAESYAGHGPGLACPESRMVHFGDAPGFHPGYFQLSLRDSIWREPLDDGVVVFGK
jgi:hypothetical protein